MPASSRKLARSVGQLRLGRAPLRLAAHSSEGKPYVANFDHADSAEQDAALCAHFTFWSHRLSFRPDQRNEPDTGAVPRYNISDKTLTNFVWSVAQGGSVGTWLVSDVGKNGSWFLRMRSSKLIQSFPLRSAIRGAAGSRRLHVYQLSHFCPSRCDITVNSRGLGQEVLPHFCTRDTEVKLFFSSANVVGDVLGFQGQERLKQGGTRQNSS
jgi:hypothetical protein